jgi:hypothetical protein
LKINSKDEFKNIHLNIQIYNANEEEQIIFIDSSDEGVFFDFSKGIFKLNIHFPYLVLGTGDYYAKIFIRHKKNFLLDRVDSLYFRVNNQEGLSYSKVFQSRFWNLSEI